MEPWTVLDCFDALWIDFHWLALDIYPLDGAFVVVNSCMKRAAVTSSASENWEGKNIKKTQIRWVYCHGNYLFSPRWSLSLLLRHSPHFPFVASLKSAPCSEPQAATREMVNELQTLFWQYFFSFFFFLKIFHLCWPTLLFFLQSTFLPGPLAASEAAMGTTGQPGVIKKLDSAWLLAQAHNWKIQICHLTKGDSNFLLDLYCTTLPLPWLQRWFPPIWTI